MGWTTPKTWATGELVTAADLNTQIRDNLSYLFAPTFQEAIGSGTDFSTTSTTNVDVTGMTVSLTTTGGNLLVVVSGKVYNSNGTYLATLAVNIDGTDYDLNENGPLIHGGAPVCAFRRFPVAAGAHTVKLRLRSNNSSNAALFAGSTYRRLLVVEGVM